MPKRVPMTRARATSNLVRKESRRGRSRKAPRAPTAPRGERGYHPGMGREATSATRQLEALDIPFETHLYRYEERGGTSHAAASLGVPESSVVKTLVMRADTGERLLVLMHGDRQVSEQRLARELGVRQIV